MPAPLAPAEGDSQLLAGRHADPDVRIVAAIVESRAVAAEFMRLGHESRPPLRWRCAGMGQAIATALVNYFAEVSE
jgi:hypothetical protein